MSSGQPALAIVDYGMGNLFSVLHAFAAVGQQAEITSDRARLAAADGLLIPGVGAFGIAMQVLERTGMADTVRERVAHGTPLVGICLGMQLMMSSSTEFGSHAGLGIIEGDTVALKASPEISPEARIPHVGWSAVQPSRGHRGWAETPLNSLAAGGEMYFVHSYYVRPADPSVVLSVSTYRGVTFCSSLVKGNVFGCQFHPERSGVEGLEIYRRIASAIRAGEPFGETR
jgi:imidazole glycerol-phosphate synthase subunit HisH